MKKLFDKLSDERFVRHFMPYALKYISGRGWIIVNRNFKPLGITTDEPFDYRYDDEFYTIHHIHEFDQLRLDCFGESGQTIRLYQSDMLQKAEVENYKGRIRFLAKVIRRQGGGELYGYISNKVKCYA